MTWLSVPGWRTRWIARAKSGEASMLRMINSP